MNEQRATKGKGSLAGSRLGDYELRSLLGAGGMGEVYRARDSRLGRDVAIKVLSGDLGSDPVRLRRFEKEAQAASALNHPSIVTVYEIGASGNNSWIAMELVEGKTLRQLLGSGPLLIRRALEIGVAIAEGLARAHEAGIVHRDLKPENVMVSDDGIVKILDFGLAKWMRSPLAADAVVAAGEGDPKTTLTFGTEPGTLLGTVRYMSPEQASGKELDFRSDQFSFGSLLYEMVTGQSAFGKDLVVDTLSAIVYEEPEPPGRINPKVPSPIAWFIERCIAKDSKDRYAATRDMARDLAKLRDHLSELSSATAIPLEVPPRRPRWRALGLAAAGFAALVGMFVLGDRARLAKTSDPHYRQLTFRGVGIGTARFSPDGRTIVFSSESEGRPPELFSMRLDSPEARSLGLPPAQILSISRSDQLAILLAPAHALGPRIGHLAFEQLVHRDPFLLGGTLARAPLGGGVPREMLDDVSFAEWDAEGKDLAVVHRSGNRSRVEYPIGTVLYENERIFLNHPRMSRSDRLAFKDWDGLFVKNPSQAATRLSADGADAEIAWSESTGEIWSSIGPGAHLEGETLIRAITPGGRVREVARLPGEFVLYDIADGRVLLGRHIETSEILASFPGGPEERNLSLFATSEASAMSGSGDEVLISDMSLNEFAYLRKTDGSEPKRVREDCSAADLSPDGTRLLCDVSAVEGFAHAFAPTGPGPLKKLESDGVRTRQTDMSGFTPDGKRVVFAGAVAGGKHRIWVQDLEGGKPRPITPDDVRRAVVMGDGRFVCALAADRGWNLYPIDEKGEPRRVQGIQPGEEPIQSSPEGLLYVRGADELRPGESLMTTRVYRLDPSTGRRELWKEFPPRDPHTGGAISTIHFSADGKICVWTHIRYSTELVLAEGLR